MAITIAERFGSRETTEGESVELLYTIEGTDSDIEAMDALTAEAPSSYNGMARQKCRIELITNNIWLGIAPYSGSGFIPREPLQQGESLYSFDTGGGTQHITQSIQTIGKYPSGTAPDFKGAVGVTHDNVEGVDITVPIYNWSETHVLDDSAVTATYKGKLFSLTGRTNDDTFRGLSAGECIFLGASGSRRGDGDWEIAFRFAASPNKTSLTVGDITGIDKKGWEYMWVRYADSDDATAKAIVKKPVAIYVEKVYEEGDFSQLGIGT